MFRRVILCALASATMIPAAALAQHGGGHGGGPPAGVGGGMGNGGLGSGGLAFLAISMPLVRRAWSGDRGLTAFVPALLFTRSLAQGLGLVAGLLVLAGRLVGRRRLRLAAGLPVARPERH